MDGRLSSKRINILWYCTFNNECGKILFEKPFILWFTNKRVCKLMILVPWIVPQLERFHLNGHTWRTMIWDFHWKDLINRTTCSAVSITWNQIRGMNGWYKQQQHQNWGKKIQLYVAVNLCLLLCFITICITYKII